MELQWAHVPLIDNNAKYKAIVNIGTNFRNEIVITGNYASRFHATVKIYKDGKAFLSDSGSKNGTKVNGTKLQPGKEVRIKRGDNVICGDVDITEQLKSYLPAPFPWLKTLAAVAAAAVLVGVAALIFMPKEPCIICGEKGCKGHPAQDFRPAVVYVRACYHYVITFEDNPMPEYWDGKFVLRNDADQEIARPYQATAFSLTVREDLLPIVMWRFLGNIAVKRKKMKFVRKWRNGFNVLLMLNPINTRKWNLCSESIDMRQLQPL